MSSLSDCPVIKLPELSERPNEHWKGDVLGRKNYSEALSCALVCHGASMTFAVNGVWGSGKTYLLKNWADDLTELGYKVIRIDAWKDDFVEDPLAVVVGQFVRSLTGWKQFVFSLSSKSGLIRAIGCLCAKLWWLVVARFSKIATLSLVDFYEIGKDINDIVKAEIQSKTWNMVDAYSKAIEAKGDFRKRFEKFTEDCFKSTKHPLVFVIDEVDRCRPTFAVALLERIKHLLNVDHAVFVLGVDMEALGATVKTVYGEIDVENYLRRFFDVKFDLPEPNRVRYIDQLWKRYLLDDRIRLFVRDPADAKNRDEVRFKELLGCFAECAGLSLREIEECMRLFMMLFLSGGHDVVLPPYLSVVMIILKLRNRKLYRDFIALTYDIEDVAEELVRIPFDDLVHGDSIVKVVGIVYALAQLRPYTEQMRRLSDLLVLPKADGWQREYGRLFTEMGAERLREVVVFATELRKNLYPDEDENHGICYDESRMREVGSCVQRLECHCVFHYPC